MFTSIHQYSNSVQLKTFPTPSEQEQFVKQELLMKSNVLLDAFAILWKTRGDSGEEQLISHRKEPPAEPDSVCVSG